MTAAKRLSIEITHEVRDTCLCLHIQRAARTLARRFDDALRSVELTHGQFSLLISLNRPEPPRIGSVAELLAMDRTTLTANLKPLQRRGLVISMVDPADKRSRRLTLTDSARALLLKAVPIWRKTHAEIDEQLSPASPGRLRNALRAISSGG
jgi:DNA-binding MarR family transcriptional regulator